MVFVPLAPKPVAGSKPTASFTPITAETPKTTEQYYQGYTPSGAFLGIASTTDPFSGRPYFAFRTPDATATTTDVTRVAPKVNPEIATTTPRSSFTNPRLPLSESQKIRASQGATAQQELDHQLALAVGGSNNAANLKLVPTETNQKASALEGKLATQVATGQISLFEAQNQEAKAKGLPLPWTDKEIKQTKDYTAQIQTLLYGKPSDKPSTFMQGIKSALFAPAAPKTNLFKDPIAPLEVGAKALVNGLTAAFEDIKTQTAVVDKNGLTTLKGIVGEGKIAVDLVNGLFTPITAALQTVASVPVIGYAADAVNNVFGAIASGGKSIGGNVVDALPVSETTKNEIRPLIEEVSALVAQFYVGGKSAETAAKIIKGTKEIVSKVNTDVATQVQILSHTPDEAKVQYRTPDKPFTPIKLPEASYQEYLKANGYEAYTSPDQLPIIAMGRKANSSLPSIQAEVPVKPNLPEGMKYVPETVVKPTPSFTPIASKATTIPTPKVEATPTVPEVSAPILTEAGVSKVGRSVEAKAVQDKITQGFDTTATYDVKPFEKAAQASTDLVNSGIEEAMKVARGEKPQPEGATTGSTLAAIEDFIKKNPDHPDVKSGKLQEELANSKMVSDTSKYAQELGSLRMREQDSATAQLDAIRKAREQRVSRTTTKTKDSVQKTLKSETQKINLSKEDLGWQKFLEDITC